VTEQFLLFHDGKVRFEKFEKGSRETKHLLWSMSKSIGSILFGIAEDKGFINREDLLSKYFSKEIDQLDTKSKQFFNSLKIKHFLEMSSGINWNEYYDKSPFNSHVVRMLYFATKNSTAQYVLKQSKRHDPGKKFYYSSGDTNVVMAAIQRSLPKKLEATYPWEFLFNPLEMDATFERDHAGTFIGSSYLYLTTRDLLKLGLFIMNKGVYKHKQIVSQEYMNYATSLNEAQGVHGKCDHSSGMTYGAQFWLNRPCKGKKTNFKDVPEDLVMLLGYGGQNVYIFPSENIVAVRIARDRRDKGVKLERDIYSRKILNAVRAWRGSNEK
jgi:CubicO group peptidase (beta-lactamase class C family)